MESSGNARDHVMGRIAKTGYDYFAAVTNDSKIRLVGSGTSPSGASQPVFPVQEKPARFAHCPPPIHQRCPDLLIDLRASLTFWLRIIDFLEALQVPVT
jgi:hypothetical protein